MTWYDFNGDGYHETFLGDSDADGVIDYAAVDTNRDGYLDTYLYDVQGDDIFDVGIADADADGYFESYLGDRNADGIMDHRFIDSDRDGRLDLFVDDWDQDGVANAIWTDLDGDGVFSTTAPMTPYGHGMSTQPHPSVLDAQLAQLTLQQQIQIRTALEQQGREIQHGFDYDSSGRIGDYRYR